MTQLAVIVDGRPAPEDEARALWTRFSAHMDRYQGDVSGFAVAEGYASASVTVADGTPTLTLTSEGADDARDDGSARPGTARDGKPRGVKQRRGQARPDDGSGGNAPPRRKR